MWTDAPTRMSRRRRLIPPNPSIGSGGTREETAEHADEAGQDGRENSLNRVCRNLLYVCDNDSSNPGNEAKPKQH